MGMPAFLFEGIQQMHNNELPDALANELAKHKGVEIHGKSLRVVFTWRGRRYRETLGLQVTKANIKHAAQLRAAILHEIKIGTFDYGRHFPDSRHATGTTRPRDERLGELAKRYMPLKAVDITPETEIRYAAGIDACLELLGRERLASALLPEDIQRLRVDLVESRAVTTVNHYLATLSGFLAWCETNGYCRSGLSAACTRFEASQREPDPLTRDELDQLLTKGCLHAQDVAAVTLAVYTGLRPGELCALAVEDVDLKRGLIHVRRAITRSKAFKVPKTGRPREVLLMPPAREAVQTLLELAADHQTENVTVLINRHEARTDRITPLLSPVTQARKRNINRWFIASAWNSKWATLLKRAGIRHRPPYQTRHTYACWCLTAHGNLAFIAKQMGHRDYTMLVRVYAHWVDDESQNELERIWRGIQTQTKKPK